MNFPAVFHLINFDPADGTTITGGLGDRMGYAVSAAGDINGDGFRDIVVTARAAGPNGLNSGTSFVIFGSAAGLAENNLGLLDGSNGFRINGLAAGDLAGFSLAFGDMNGDGYDDIALGAPGAGGGHGAVYVVYGKADGFDPELDLSTLDGANGFRFSAEAPGGAGASVALADVTGDGLADLIVGAPDHNNRGAVHVIFGAEDPGAAVVTPTDFAGGLGFSRYFTTENADFGIGVGAADLNGDGIADILVGAWAAAVNRYTEGAVLVIDGGAGPWTPSDTLSQFADGHIHGAENYDYTGQAVASAGDVNGDGVEDMIIGSSRRPGNQRYGGAYVVFGQQVGLGPSFDLAGLDGTNGFLIAGTGFYSDAGVSVASAGDIDGDGYGDLIIGAPGISNFLVPGEAYVLFGKAAFGSGVIQAADLAGHDGFRIEGAGFDYAAGAAVAGAGDLNGDGFDDLLVGSPGVNGGGGRVYIIYGRVRDQADVGGSGADVLSGHLGEDLLSGMDGDDRLSGGAADDELNGGQGNDLLDGGSGADAMDGGAGNDTYIVDDLGDTVTELGGGGSDRVRASVSFTLSNDLENLVLEGTADLDGTGNALANVLDGNSGANTLSGGGGADLIKGGAGNDTLDGGTGSDQLLGGIGTDSLDGADDNDRLEGGDGNDTILGGAGADILDGGADNDQLTGGAGADQLFGGTGTDTLDGGSENDVLNGGLGADAMTGGIGDDIFFVDDAADTTIELASQGVDQVRASISHTLADNIETLTLQDVANLDGTGNGLANTLNGNSGDNVLDGVGGNDILKGGDGSDTLIGGAGNDIMLGGGGLDTFIVRQESVYSSLVPAGGVLEVDTVSDYALGVDRIDLSAIDAMAGGSDDAFTLVGAFTGAGGQMTLTFAGGITTLALDIDGDRKADYMMRINGDVRAESGGWAL